MKASFWEKIQQQARGWREVLLPGAFIVGFVILARLSGVLETPELIAFDELIRLRPSVIPTSRIVIVEIDEADLKRVGSFPIADRDLLQALKILQECRPRVIGIALLRDTPVENDRDSLVQAFNDMPNIIGTEAVLNRNESLNVRSPNVKPLELPPERVGFTDLIIDNDGKIRRGVLASQTWQGELKYSFPMRLAQAYLSTEGIAFKHGTRISNPIEFGSTQLPRFRANSGGYIRANANDYQMLLNFSTGDRAFRSITLTEILERKFDPTWIRDRIAIVGMTTGSIQDTFITNSVRSTLLSAKNKNNSFSFNLISRVEVHAHTTSQIVESAFGTRSLIQVFSDIREYLWIAFWGLLGIACSIIFRSVWKTLVSLIITGIILISISYLFMVFCWWIPLVPTLLSLYGTGFIAAFFNRDLRFLLEQRRITIEHTYDAVHNGPLQQLAVILRSLGERDLSTEWLRSQLQELNQEIRSIYESMRQKTLTYGNSLYLNGNLLLDLKTSIADLLYQVYDRTLDREFPGFATIRTYIPPDFKPLERCYLNSTQKRGLCLFLEEALCNVGKHAIGTTRLDVTCTKEAGWYSIQIIDNGVGMGSISHSRLSKQRGTKQAQELARQLRGKFHRRQNFPQGTICELTWRESKFWLMK